MEVSPGEGRTPRPYRLVSRRERLSRRRCTSGRGRTHSPIVVLSRTGARREAAGQPTCGPVLVARLGIEREWVCAHRLVCANCGVTLGRYPAGLCPDLPGAASDGRAA